MTAGLRRLLAMSLAAALMLAVVWLIASHDQAQSQVANTCNDVGEFTNLTASTSGEWGSITFDDTEPTLTLVVEEGFEVTLCVKAGSAQQGDGPEVSGPYGEGTYEVAHSSDKELSHYGFTFDTVTTTTQGDEEPTTTQGDEETTTSTTTTTTSSSSSTTTVPGDTTTTSTPGSTSTVPQSSTTTTPGSTTSQVPPAPPTTHNTPSPEELPFTGIEDWLAPLAGILALVGLVILSIAGRVEEE